MIRSLTIDRLAGIGMLTGTGTVMADVIPLPDGFANWPATVILGFITLVTLGLLYYKTKQECADKAKEIEAIVQHAAAMARQNELMAQTNTGLHDLTLAIIERPCLLEGKEVREKG